MPEYKPLEIVENPTAEVHNLEDILYWKNLKFSHAFKEFGGIDYIDFTNQEPYYAAVTCSARVRIYDIVNNTVFQTLLRFPKNAYGGTFRSDGSLLLAGTEDGSMRLFNVQKNRMLRVFKGHKAATHRCGFIPDGTQVISFSDDKTINMWDILTEKINQTFAEHKDYIRGGSISQASNDLFISGSYDHTVKMYDVRTGGSVATFDHGVPVESVLMFPAGGLFISAGGTNLKVWDPVAGRMLTQLSQHHKTITSICFGQDGRRLISASLDRSVKIYDLTSYEVVHNFNYSSAILSVAVAPDDKYLGVGMTDGLFHLRQKNIVKTVTQEKPKKYQVDIELAEKDEQRRKAKLKFYDRHLQRFNSSRALDEVLERTSPSAEETITVMMELIRRGNIKAAMAGREDESLNSLLKFVTKYIADPRYMRVLIDIGLMLVEIYSPQFDNPEVKKKFEILLDVVQSQVSHMKGMMEVQGIIQTVLASVHSPGDKEEEVILSEGISKGSDVHRDFWP